MITRIDTYGAKLTDHGIGTALEPVHPLISWATGFANDRTGTRRHLEEIENVPLLDHRIEQQIVRHEPEPFRAGFEQGVPCVPEEILEVILKADDLGDIRSAVRPRVRGRYAAEKATRMVDN